MKITINVHEELKFISFVKVGLGDIYLIDSGKYL